MTLLNKPLLKSVVVVVLKILISTHELSMQNNIPQTKVTIYKQCTVVLYKILCLSMEFQRKDRQKQQIHQIISLSSYHYEYDYTYVPNVGNQGLQKFL